MTLSIAKILRKFSYRGVFNVDALWDPIQDSLHPIELNPRLPGSLPTASWAQSEYFPPLYTLHVLEYLDISYTTSRRRATPPPANPISQFIIWNNFGQDVIPKRTLPEGIYHFNKESVVFSRHGNSLSDLKQDKEFLIIKSFVQKGRLCKENKQLFHVIAPFSIITSRGALTQKGGSIIKKTQEYIKSFLIETDI